MYVLARIGYRRVVLARMLRKSTVWLAVVVFTGAAFALLVMRQGSAVGSTPQLPNLVADPPDNMSLDQQGLPGHLLLRFNGYIHNIGPGALEIDGSRGTPDPSNLASPPMQVFQNIFNDDGTSAMTALPSAQMIYVSADGHNHWHLQHAAFYSLWNSAKTAQVAPAQKVGFCLDDSQHVDSWGPSVGVYTDANGRNFCQQFNPGATSVWEGISSGWRDRYDSDLYFQWVDVSDVLPGVYYVREDVNPPISSGGPGIIETAPNNAPAYSSAFTLPGFIAQSQGVSTAAATPVSITLRSQAFNDGATPRYTIASGPSHGSLGSVNGNQVTYTPAPGFSGSDSFTFSAADPNSQFPLHPAVATVSISVASPLPSVAISGAPASMLAGTSVQLGATVSNDSGGVSWGVSAGTITAAGLYTAPASVPAGGSVTITATSAHGGKDQRTISILAPPPPKPAPIAPLPLPISRQTAALSAPEALRIGRQLVVTVGITKPGRVRITVYAGRRLIGSCVARTAGHRTFTCRLRLPKGVSIHARITIWAGLRVGRHLYLTERRAAQVFGVRS